MLFLEMSSDAQERFASSMFRLRILAADGKMHDIRLNDKDVGVTVMIAPRSQAARLELQLEAWCRLRKYQAKATTWLGLGFASESAGTPSHYIFASHDWAPDPGLDALLEARGEPKPGR